jgi:hypothetical protein
VLSSLFLLFVLALSSEPEEGNSSLVRVAVKNFDIIGVGRDPPEPRRQYSDMHEEITIMTANDEMKGSAIANGNPAGLVNRQGQ